MTRMTRNGISTTTTPGQEQYEPFTYRSGRKAVDMVQYDFRHPAYGLFSCTARTLEDCRAKRDAWVDAQVAKPTPLTELNSFFA